MTATHLESAALLLETHIAVDDPSKDLPEHAEARQMAARPYNLNEVDVPFTEAEIDVGVVYGYLRTKEQGD
ncbi:hypothetical protein MRX96_041675 [Rhipicephalus microplus]